MTDLTISIRALNKQFGRFTALNGVNLDIAPGELLALLGPSGSGKTTLLRSIAGLEFPDTGQVLFDGEDVTLASPTARRVGFVFQQYALFSHLTVAKNVAFGLEVRKGSDKPPKTEITRRVDELLKLVELNGVGARYPSQLSGGQRQRVALSRALAVGPRVLLLDEPFGALDVSVRRSLRKELRRIHDATGVTTIFVTHDQEEALELADRVAILNSGQIEQVGMPHEVYDNPVNAFVCGFMGEANRFEGRVVSGAFTAGPVSLAALGVADGNAVAYVRPHDLVQAKFGLSTTVTRVVQQGPLAKVEGITQQGAPISATLARDVAAALVPGTVVTLGVQKAYIYAVT